MPFDGELDCLFVWMNDIVCVCVVCVCCLCLYVCVCE